MPVLLMINTNVHATSHYFQVITYHIVLVKFSFSTEYTCI